MFAFARSAVASLMIATAAAAAPEGPKLPPDDERWLRVRSENFTLYSGVGEAETTALARELEMLRAVMRKFVAGAAAGAGKPVSVYVFRSAKRFQDYAGDILGDNKDLAGFHVTSVERNMFVINSGVPASPRSTIFHEYAHEVFGTMFRNLPLWASEGLAELYTTFRVIGGKAEIGRADPETVRLARQGAMIPLPVLLAADTTSPLYNHDDKQGKFYAQSWALVHMLLHGNAERRAQLPHYLTLLDKGEAAGAAFETAFGTDTEGLSRELAAYVRRDSFPMSIAAAGDIPSAWVGGPERLDRADTLIHLGVLLARTRDDPAPAEAHFRAALQADPARPLAEAGLASLLFKRKRYDEALALYDRALERDPREPSTNLLAAMALLDRFAANDRPDRDASVLPPEIARARAMLGVVLEFRPNDPFVLGAYGTTWVYDPGDLAPGIRALEKAVALAPLDRAMLFNLVQLHAAAGDAEKARAVIDGPLARVAKGDDLARARESLVQIDVRAAEDAVEAGDLGKAIALLEQARERTSDARTRTRAEARLATLRSAAVRKAEIDRFNEAAELFNARTYDRARTILDALVRDAQNEDIRGRAKELLTRIP